MKYNLFVLLSLICFSGYAQKSNLAHEDIPYRPRIVELGLTTLYDYKSTSDSETFGSSSTEYELDQKMSVRLGIPLILKNKTLMGFQLKYDNQDFLLEFESPNNYELYNHIKDADFRSIGARFILQKEVSEGKNLSVLVGSEIKSDKLYFGKNTSKTYANVNYKIDKNDHVTIGGGVMVSYTLSAPQVYPIFYYENELNSKWTLDLALPKAAIMRLKVSNKCYLSFKTEVKGWRYAVHNAQLSDSELLTLRKSDIHFGLNFEHEIHDWLWFGIDAGVSKNLRYYLAKPGDRRRDALIDLTANSAPYTQFSIFIVPPKKIYSR